jgi:hypothetical protein
MTSRVELDINIRQAQLAELLADARNTPKWMDDLDRIEPISGEPGQPGSVYRLVPKEGSLVFVATVLTRSLPTIVRVSLVARRISVLVTDTFVGLSENRTRLISEEVFTFTGTLSKVTGFVGRRSIARAHRQHMESFKRFAESHAR